VAADALVEEHLLACEECRARLVEWEEYVGAMRAVPELCLDSVQITSSIPICS
jgi:predicted anti-sigma-YlaC factor YlaD